MNREDIIRMAKEAWFGDLVSSIEYEYEYFEHFAKLVAAVEREECARICDRFDSRTWHEPRFNMADEIAEAIRKGVKND